MSMCETHTPIGVLKFRGPDQECLDSTVLQTKIQDPPTVKPPYRAADCPWYCENNCTREQNNKPILYAHPARDSTSASANSGGPCVRPSMILVKEHKMAQRELRNLSGCMRLLDFAILQRGLSRRTNKSISCCLQEGCG